MHHQIIRDSFNSHGNTADRGFSRVIQMDPREQSSGMSPYRTPGTFSFDLETKRFQVGRHPIGSVKNEVIQPVEKPGIGDLVQHRIHAGDFGIDGLHRLKLVEYKKFGIRMTIPLKFMCFHGNTLRSCDVGSFDRYYFKEFHRN